MTVPSPLSLAQDVAARYGALPQVEAVTLAGSQTTGTADPRSDLDMYVYARDLIPLGDRARIATLHAERAEVDNQYWEPGDEWIEGGSHLAVDVMFRSPAWIEEQLDRVLRRHAASVGYSTCFWHNVLTSRILYDRAGWFRALQQSADQPYPEPLRRAIVAKNYPILRRTISSYTHQLERAVDHADPVSVNHRVAALLASYFDVLFAVNRLPHPGEKRQLELLQRQASMLPADMDAQVRALLRAAADDSTQVLSRAAALLEGLDCLLQSEGLISA